MAEEVPVMLCTKTGREYISYYYGKDAVCPMCREENVEGHTEVAYYVLGDSRKHAVLSWAMGNYTRIDHDG